MGESGSVLSAPVVFEAPDRPEVEVSWENRERGDKAGGREGCTIFCICVICMFVERDNKTERGGGCTR